MHSYVNSFPHPRQSTSRVQNSNIAQNLCPPCSLKPSCPYKPYVHSCIPKSKGLTKLKISVSSFFNGRVLFFVLCEQVCLFYNVFKFGPPSQNYIAVHVCVHMNYQRLCVLIFCLGSLLQSLECTCMYLRY